MFGVLVVFYVAAAIKYDRTFRQQTGGAIPGKHIPWPSWAWCLGIAASLLWLLVSIFMLGKHNSQTLFSGNEVYVCLFLLCMLAWSTAIYFGQKLQYTLECA